MAVEMQYLEFNISKRVKAVPKGKAVVPYWTKTEFEKVISAICIDDFYEHLCFVTLWIYFMTGVRVNEGTALWWEDVDFDKKRLRVHYMLVLKNKNDWVRNDYSKTDDGKRIIAIDSDTIRILKEWKDRQEKIGIKNFVLSYDGMPMIKSTLARIIERYAKLAKVHKIQAKGLRHSHALYLINEFNVNIPVLSKRLGHSSPEVTLKHYSHMWAGADESIADVMSGNIKVTLASKTNIEFNGNQAVKK